MSVGAISGLGNTKICSVISITLTALRIPIAMVLCGTALGAKGLWWALTITTVLKGISFYIAFKRESKNKKKEIAQN
jgi:Na+-driven multidrug efflux pump